MHETHEDGQMSEQRAPSAEKVQQPQRVLRTPPFLHFPPPSNHLPTNHVHLLQHPHPNGEKLPRHRPVLIRIERDLPARISRSDEQSKAQPFDLERPQLPSWTSRTSWSGPYAQRCKERDDSSCAEKLVEDFEDGREEGRS